LRILLIDDSSAYHEEFRMLLLDSGIQFSALDVALTATEGARLINASVHDIYFVDFRLPADSGLTLVRTARASGVVKPIIVLTAYDHPAVDTGAESAGATDYLRKGDFTPAALNRAIRYAVSNAASTEAAKAAELRFVMAQEAANIGTWEWNIGSNAVIWSAQQYSNFGLDPETAGPVTYEMSRSLIHPEDREHVDAALAAAISGQSPLSLKFRITIDDPRQSRPGPQVHWISAKGRVIRDARGTPTQMVGVSIDITEQQNALNAVRDSRNVAVAGLQVSEARFKAYFESAPECLFLVRVAPDRRFLFETVNPAGLGHLGITLEAIRNRTPEEVLGRENGLILTKGLLQVLETGSPYVYEPTFHLNPNSIVYDAIYIPLFDENREVVAIIGNARDVTERRRLETSLRQSQKMEALGQLASGVAHDFNNLLQGMLGCLDMLGKQVVSEKGTTLIEEGRRTVERGINLTNRLLAFSRHQPMTTQPVDLNSSIEEMTTLLARTLEGVRVTKILAPDLWLSVADRNQIELAVLNLAINARDAMPVGGKFMIETSNERLSGVQEDGLAPGDYVSVKLSDTGVGMPPEIITRAVDPFFTTKPEGKGTGLGLSMVYGMVRQLGGGLRISSTVGKGTAVTILLPRACTAAQSASVATPAMSAPQSASILLVENDPDTQAVVRAYAADSGLSVVVAQSGREALALLAGGLSVEVVIADATLPVISGSAVVEMVRARHPDVQALLLSSRPDVATARETGAMATLTKPFDVVAFRRAVLPLLRNAPGSPKVVDIQSESRRRG
jgi:PAS domain S-box-containing protein